MGRIVLRTGTRKGLPGFCNEPDILQSIHPDTHAGCINIGGAHQSTFYIKARSFYPNNLQKP